jgi:hypothetical protein
MSKTHNWDKKNTKEILLPSSIYEKYLSKKEYSLADIDNIFRNSFYDFEKKDLRMDYFSEISKQLWWVLVKQKMEKNKLGEIILMASEINFYFDSDKLDMINDILYDISQFLKTNQ